MTNELRFYNSFMEKYKVSPWAVEIGVTDRGIIFDKMIRAISIWINTAEDKAAFERLAGRTIDIFFPDYVFGEDL